MIMIQCLDEIKNDRATDLEQVLSQTVSAIDQNKVSLPKIERLFLRTFRSLRSAKKLKEAKIKRPLCFVQRMQLKLSDEQNDLFINKLGGIFRRVCYENIDIKLKVISGLESFDSIVKAFSGDQKG